MNDSKLAQSILSAVGGRENITYVTHCITRLRFNLKDTGIVNRDEITNIDGVLGIQESAGQYQVIVGTAVGQVYKELCLAAGISETENSPSTGGNSENLPKSGGIISSILAAIIGCIAPLIPILIGTGLGKCLLLVVSMTGLANANNSMTFYVFNLVFDSCFTFLPVFTAVAAARHFRCNIFISALMGCALLHPNWASMVSAADPKVIGDMFGIPLYGMAYSSTLVPAILIVWVLSHVERLLEKHTPEVLKSMIVPLGTLLVMTPLTFLLLAPSMGYVSIVLGNALMFVYEKFGGVVLALMGIIYPWMVVTGTHSTLAIAGMQIMSQSGFDPFSRTLPLAHNFAQGAAALACALRTRDTKLRSTCLSTAFTVFVAGVSEPVIYGVTLRLKRPMYAVMIGCATGCLFAGVMSLRAFTWMTPSLLNVAMWMGDAGISNVIVAVATMAISSVVSFIAALLMGTGEEQSAPECSRE